MSRMLASVADATEAVCALAAGADWIDVKDPGAGALGMAARAVVEDVVRAVDGRAPVSATLGDTWQCLDEIPARARQLAGSGVDYLKAGVDAAGLDAAAVRHIAAAAEAGRPLIAVCMAERPPSSADVRALAASGVSGAMLDTANKQGPGLTGLMDTTALAGFVGAVRDAGLLCGLAGRLELRDVAALGALDADYLGFRSALCARGSRTDTIDEQACREVRAALDAATRQHRAHSEVA
ncbi:MAG: (5-formylfuran-3-yl)methyl phosphate synthase [Gammaproteobacteria bacterium]